MLVGAAIYAETSGWVSQTLTPIGDLGKVSFADVTGLSTGLFVGLLVVAALAVRLLVGKRLGGKAAA